MRTGQTEIGHGHVDQVRMSRPHILRHQSELALPLVAQVFNQDVRLIAQRGEAASPGSVSRVDHRPTLVGIAIQERQRAVRRGHVAGERRLQAARVAPRRFDLDDVGAEVGKQPARQGAAQVGEIENVQMPQRCGRHATHSKQKGRPGTNGQSIGATAAGAH
jgi:hypothetical protein